MILLHTHSNVCATVEGRCLEYLVCITLANEAKKIRKWPSFSIPPILNIFFQKFHGLVLGLMGLIDTKGIDVAQPIWP